MDEYFNLYEGHGLVVTHSHPLSRVSQFCLYYEWMACSILAGVLGSNQWCLAPAEIAGVTGDWAHEFSDAQSVKRLCEVPSAPNSLPHVSGTNRVALLFYGLFSADFIRMACQWQQPPADLQEVVISPSALVPLSAGGGSAAWCLVPFYKEKIIFIGHTREASLVCHRLAWRQDGTVTPLCRQESQHRREILS